MTESVIKITKESVKALLPKRLAESNKGTYGKVLNIAGCTNYQGAAFFSSLAPLKVGAGLVTLATTKQVINNLSSSIPWVTFFPLKDFNEKCIDSVAFDEIKDLFDSYDVISIGAGLSVEPTVCAFVENVLECLKDSNKKIVIDADALNIIAKLKTEKLPKNAVITPHPMELSRLLGVSVETIQNDRTFYAKEAAHRFGCNVVLKGNKTIITSLCEEIFQNSTGNSALAKAGSGDVLTGMIAGFAAQGLRVFDASIIAVYLHGLCGELASNELTQYSVLATDQISYIPKAISTLLG